jgi:hypothetical protein
MTARRDFALEAGDVLFSTGRRPETRMRLLAHSSQTL